MQLATFSTLFFAQWLVAVGVVPCCLHGLLGGLFAESFSPHHLTGGRPRTHALNGDDAFIVVRHQAKKRRVYDEDVEVENDIDISNINEAQLLLACRSWLLRKHKVEWKGKKRRSEAAASPLSNEGYFWPDPNDLLYLREDPDPYNLEYNETYGEYYGYKRNNVRFLASKDTTYSGKNYLADDIMDPPVDVERSFTSTNPFSSNPLYPDEEHVRRSEAKLKLFNNATWKEEWYNRRWRGRVATKAQKTRDKQDKLVRDISNDILESPSFDSMTEDEVKEAIFTYLNANQRKSESRKNNKYKRQEERESFREWREQVKKNAEKLRSMDGSGLNSTTMKDLVSRVVPPPSNNEDDDMLSFSPSVETMELLRAKRSEKSRKAFQTRLANSKANTNTTSSTKEITKLQQSGDYDMEDTSLDDEPGGEVSPVQALLHIDMALDHNKLPSPVDIEIILKPGRLGRRRAILQRILSECYDLRGKCVPPLSGNDSDLIFVTKCTIRELGAFVLSKLRQNN